MLKLHAGTKIYAHPYGIEYLYPDGNHAIYITAALTDAIADDILQKKINHLVIKEYKPWKVSKFPQLRLTIDRVWFQDSNVPLSLLEGFDKLKSLHLNQPADVDFSRFVYLEDCSLAHQYVFPSTLSSCKHLKKLSLDYCKFSSIEEIARMSTLEKLVLGSVSVNTLQPISALNRLSHFGIDNLKEVDLSFLIGCVSLKSCRLVRPSKLENLLGIEGLRQLEEFSVSNSIKLKDLGPLGTLDSITTLVFDSCPNLESLRPLLSLKGLRKLLLWESTRIMDGDLRCMLDSPRLQEFSFKNRRDYNITNDGVKAFFAQRETYSPDTNSE